jgi:quercetin dioxygenase-like cupin family protein
METIRLEQDGYTSWLEREGIPVHTGYAVEDVKRLPLAPWPRLGGLGAYVRLVGCEDATGMYVCEIPPGGRLAPEKHLFEAVIYGLAGHARAEYWQDGEPRVAVTWKGGSLFAHPLNVWPEMVNLSADEPARFMAVTNAPAAFRLYRDPDFIFGCDFRFPERYTYDPAYFDATPRVVRVPRGEHVYEHYYRNNFVPDLDEMELEVMPPEITRGEGVRKRRVLLANNTLITFAHDYLPGTYTKAHSHEPGFQVFIARGTGFTLMWPPEAGMQPFSEDHGEQVVRVNFGPGTVLVPPKGWYHQHFNTGREPILYVPTGPGQGRVTSRGSTASLTSIRHGGNQVDYDLEDPEIRALFEHALRHNGTPNGMAAVYAAG